MLSQLNHLLFLFVLILAIAVGLPSPMPLHSGEFLVIAYPSPPQEEANVERYREITSAGIDVIVPGNGEFDGPGNKRVLDLAAQVGLRVVVADRRIQPWHKEDRIHIDQGNIEAVASTYRNHPALLAYFICDEPHARYFAELASTSRRLRAAEPNHPPLINLFPSYASREQLGFDDFPSYVRTFIETTKPSVLCYDHYPLREARLHQSDWYGDLQLIREESRKARIPFWICLQSEGIEGALRIPKREEVFWQASTVLAYGARAVVWFTYWTPTPTQGIPADDSGKDYLIEPHISGMISRDGKRTPVYDHVREANVFLHNAGGELANWDNTHIARWKDGKIIDGSESPCLVPHGENLSLVVGTFSQGDQRRVVIANGSYSQPTTFSIEANSAWQASKVVAALEIKNKAAEGIDRAQWTLRPGSCLVIEFEIK
jgi:hypothetical protein